MSLWHHMGYTSRDHAIAAIGEHAVRDAERRHHGPAQPYVRPLSIRDTLRLTRANAE